MGKFYVSKTWLYLFLFGQHKSKLNKIMPQSMKDKFLKVGCVIDCVEFKVAVPSPLILCNMLYSEYKSCHSKSIGIAPGRGFTFISSLFPGSISDEDITINSGILNSRFLEYW